jgi:hypothetical protein
MNDRQRKASKAVRLAYSEFIQAAIEAPIAVLPAQLRDLKLKYQAALKAQSRVQSEEHKAKIKRRRERKHAKLEKKRNMRKES